MMKKLIRGTTAFVLAGALSLAGCSDSKTGPSDSDGEGYLRADLSGSYSGKLNATGKDMDKAPELRREVAGAAHITEGGQDFLVVMGVELTGSSLQYDRGHMISFLIIDPKVGTYTAGDFCVYGDPDSLLDGCSIMALFSASDGEIEWESVLGEGSLRITDLSADRISGTFDLNGASFTRPLDFERSWDEEAEDDGWEPAGKVNVKNGKYDLEIMDFADLDDFFATQIGGRVAGDGLRLDALRGPWEGRLSPLDR